MINIEEANITGLIKKIRPEINTVVVRHGDYINSVFEAYHSELDLLIGKVENAKEELERYRVETRG